MRLYYFVKEWTLFIICAIRGHKWVPCLCNACSGSICTRCFDWSPYNLTIEHNPKPRIRVDKGEDIWDHTLPKDDKL